MTPEEVFHYRVNLVCQVLGCTYSNNYFCYDLNHGNYVYIYITKEEELTTQNIMSKCMDAAYDQGLQYGRDYP